MFTNCSFTLIEQRANLSLCQPYRFIFQFHFKTGLTVRSLIENDPALSGLFYDYVITHTYTTLNRTVYKEKWAGII